MGDGGGLGTDGGDMTDPSHDFNIDSYVDNGGGDDVE